MIIFVILKSNGSHLFPSSSSSSFFFSWSLSFRNMRQLVWPLNMWSPGDSVLKCILRLNEKAAIETSQTHERKQGQKPKSRPSLLFMSNEGPKSLSGHFFKYHTIFLHHRALRCCKNVNVCVVCLWLYF